MESKICASYILLCISNLWLFNIVNYKKNDRVIFGRKYFGRIIYNTFFINKKLIQL